MNSIQRPTQKFNPQQLWPASIPTHAFIPPSQVAGSDKMKNISGMACHNMNATLASSCFSSLFYGVFSVQFTRRLNLQKFQRSKSSNSWFATTLLIFFMCVLALLTTPAEARVYVVHPRSPKCKVQQNSELHVLMDRICLLCHEMFSYEKPNMRAECRSNCFRTDHFQKCLAIFTPAKQAAKLLLDIH